MDQDCAGDDDYDRDGDASSAKAYGGTDCDDGDSLIGPHADEVWYDGVDQDCDGGNDYDADGDGYTSADYDGDDCDDATDAAHPGATEVWYDDIDGDCLGGDDHDADLDGYPRGDELGEDCDDADPGRNPLTVEVFGDGHDGDCDGGEDSFGFPHSPSYEIVGLQGPVVHVSELEFTIGYAAEEIIDSSGADPYYDALGIVVFGAGTFQTGPVLEYPYGFNISSGTMGEALDFWSNGIQNVWLSSLYKPGTNSRFLYLDALDFGAPVNNSSATYPIADSLFGYPFSDVDLWVDDDSGALTAVACEPGGSTLSVVQDTVHEFVLDGTPTLSQTVSESYGLCEVSNNRTGSPNLWVTAPGQEGVTEGSIDANSWKDGGPVDFTGLPIADWTLVDWEMGILHGRTWTLLVDLVDGIYLWPDTEKNAHLTGGDDGTSALWDGNSGDWIQPEGAGMVQADLAVDGAGTIYVCAVSEVGEVHFWYGPSGSLTEVPLQTGLTTAEHCSLGADTSGMVVVAVRGDDRLVVGGVKNPVPE